MDHDLTFPSGSHEDPLEQALGRFARSYLAGRNLARRTRVEYLADLHDAIAFLLKRNVTRTNRVSQGDLEAYLAELDHRGLKGSSRRRKATSLRVFFRFLHQQGHLGLSPAEQVIPPAKESSPPRFLTHPEYQRLLAAARHHPRDLAILELFLQTGIRRLELLNLLLIDVELPAKLPRGERAAGALTVRSGKGRKDRTVTLNDSACRALMASGGVSTRTICTCLSPSSSGVWAPGASRDVVVKYLKLAKIDGASVHSLRHTFATQHVRKGTELSVVKAALGHQNLATTSRYVGMVREQMDKRLQ